MILLMKESIGRKLIGYKKPPEFQKTPEVCPPSLLVLLKASADEVDCTGFEPVTPTLSK